jgi:hypothetical protein
MEDLKRTIALLFKRKGQPILSERDFVFSASMDMRWFPPKEAQRLLEVALKRGLLSLQDGKLTPNFDLDKVDVPLDFAPSEEVLKGDDDVFQRMVQEISRASGRPAKDVVARINAIRSMMGIYGEVAALLAGSEMGVDMKPFYPDVEDILRSRRPSPPSESGRQG